MTRCARGTEGYYLPGLLRTVAAFFQVFNANVLCPLGLPPPFLLCPAGFVHLFIVNLTQVIVMWKDRTSTKKMPPSDWPVGKFVGAFSRLMIGA